MFDALLSDIRFAVRTLWKAPGFSLVAVSTLALGIGANTAIFSVVDHVLVRPLAYSSAERLYAVHESSPRFARMVPLLPVNAKHFLEWRRSSRSFEQMALIGAMSLNLTGNGEPERLSAARATPALFPMLGVRMQLGRAFLEEEDRPGNDAVVILDDRLWRRRFAADPSIVGRRILLDGRPYEIVGVLPGNFRFPKINQLYAMTIAGERPELWKPFAVRPEELTSLGDFNFACVASIRPGIWPAAATEDLNAIQARLDAEAPAKLELHASLVPMRDQITGRSRSGLQLLLAATGVVLLIGCVNIANLLLTRATGRRREVAIRSAIGANWWRLVRQMLAESFVIAAAGGAAGAALAYAAAGVLTRTAPIDLPRADEIHVDGRVLLYTIAVSLATGLLFGLLPALRFASADPQDALRSAERGTTQSARSGRVRAILVGAEVGLSALCLAIGGLLLHSFVKILRVDAGFQPERVVTVAVNLPPSRYPDHPSRVAFTRELLRRASAIPGVTSAGVSNMLPLGGEGSNNAIIPESSVGTTPEPPIADVRLVNPDYFRTLGIPLQKGRIFEERDRDRAVAVVSISTVARFWPDRDPIGQRFHIGSRDLPAVEVAGVVGDIHGVSLTKAPSMTIYIPYWQRTRAQTNLVVRTALTRGSTASSLRAIVHEIDPELPVSAPRSMDDIVTGSVAQQRFQTNLVLAFGAIAMVLATLGIFGVVSYSVMRRTNEIGIRMALGARPERIRWLVLRQTLMPVAAGLAAGVVAGVLAGRVMGGLLFEVSAADPTTLTSVLLLLGGVAGLAAYLPARRATAIDPVTALRAE